MYKKTIREYKGDLPSYFISITDEIKTCINLIPHPDPTYVSFLTLSSNHSQLLRNKKKIALNLESDLSFLRKRTCFVHNVFFLTKSGKYII